MRTLSGDTLDAFEVKDADGDGRLWNPADGDSGLVDVRHKQIAPALRPAVAVFTQRVRAVIFKETGRSYAISHFENRTDKDGRQVTYSVRGARTDSSYAPGDTVTVTVRSTPSSAAQGRVAERIGRYFIRLSETPGVGSGSSVSGGNALIRFTMETRWREGAFARGPVASTRLEFVPDSAVQAGNLTLTGRVTVEAEFADGSTGTLEGRFEDRRIDADRVELKTGTGTRRFKVQWDGADGRILRQETLPE
jgi:hypothetical protein